MTVNARPMADGSGDVIGAVLSFRDVTSGLAARRSLDFQASLLDQIGAAVITTDMEGRVTSWNRQAEMLYGWTADEAMGRTAVELTIPDDQMARIPEIGESLVSHGSWRGDFVAQRKDGTTFPVLASSVLMVDDRVPVGVASVTTDATDLRSIEAEARRLGTLATGVLESVPFPVAVVADDGEILVVNRAWAQFAESNDGSPATTGVGVNYLHATAAASADETAASALVGLRAMLAGTLSEFDLEYPCHAPDEERWFRMLATPLPGIGAVVAHIDVTAQHVARAALEDLVASKDQFIASVSHELRTPLTAVLGLAEELRDGVFEPDEVDEFHRLVADQARDLSYLVEDLLIAARLDGAAIRTETTVVDLAAQMVSVLDPMPPEMAKAIDVDLAALRGEVLGDPVRVRQVLRNLIVNAFRHGQPPVEIDIVVGSDTATLQVTDHGTGAPDEIIETLFNPYVKASRTGVSVESIGLGLYVSHRLARLMGGDLTYHRDGGRTVFSLVLPVAPAVLEVAAAV